MKYQIENACCFCSILCFAIVLSRARDVVARGYLKPELCEMVLLQLRAGDLVQLPLGGLLQ